MKTLYLDVCCWNRPFDDQTQPRIHLEAEAVLAIIAAIQRGQCRLISSEAIDLEIDQTPDQERLERLRNSIPQTRTRVEFDNHAVTRARELEALGFPAMDALHLAAAEAAHADVFLTTDDRLLRRARRARKRLRVRVENPLIWLQTMVRERR